MYSKIPRYVKEIIEKLEKVGYQAFIVGGSVRDLLLGKEPSDYDITTNAKPDKIINIFKDYKTILTGIEFGTATVVVDENNIEVTSYRIEEGYIDGRRPSKVDFTDSLEGDLSRRDFTINAMAYNYKLGLIDPFNGSEDLRNRLIKTVGNPMERFQEDHLRILRAIRFVAQLDFTIEEDTYKACGEMAGYLSNISVERIRDELFKILLSKKPSKALNIMKDLKILRLILPEIGPTIGFEQKNPHHDKNVFEHSLCVVDSSQPILTTRLAALFHDIAKPHTFTLDEEGVGHFYGHDKMGAGISRKILTRLHCANDLISSVESLIREHMNFHVEIKEKGLKRLIARVGEEEIFNLIDLQKSDKICTNPHAKIDDIIDREGQIRKILEYKEPYEKKQLDINGNDIINLGYKEGKEIGQILDYLMDRVLDNPSLNTRDRLIKIIKEDLGV